MFFQKLLQKNCIKLFAIFVLSTLVFFEQGYTKEEVKNKPLHDTTNPSLQKISSTSTNGIIDYGILFNESKQGKKLIQELKDKYEPLHLKLKNQNRELADSEKKLQIDKPSLGQHEFQRESIRIKQGYELLQIDEQIFQDSRVRDEEDARYKMHKEIDAAIKLVADSLHLDLVLERSMALYMSTKIDITRDVLQELNKDLK